MFHLLSRIDGKVITMDLRLLDPDRLKVLKMYAPNFHFLQENSNLPATRDKVVELVNKELFDIVYIDGSHTYGAVKKDTELYAPLIKPNGYIIWHDYFVVGENFNKPEGKFKGINEYITELIERGVPVQKFFEDGSCLAYIKGSEWLSV